MFVERTVEHEKEVPWIKYLYLTKRTNKRKVDTGRSDVLDGPDSNENETTDNRIIPKFSINNFSVLLFKETRPFFVYEILGLKTLLFQVRKRFSETKRRDSSIKIGNKTGKCQRHYLGRTEGTFGSTERTIKDLFQYLGSKNFCNTIRLGSPVTIVGRQTIELTLDGRRTLPTQHVPLKYCSLRIYFREFPTVCQSFQLLPKITSIFSILLPTTVRSYVKK